MNDIMNNGKQVRDHDIMYSDSGKSSNLEMQASNIKDEWIGAWKRFDSSVLDVKYAASEIIKLTENERKVSTPSRSEISTK